MKSASCCNECFFQRKLSTLSNGEKHFHPVRQFPSQALLGIQHTVPVILHSSPHFVFEIFPSAVLKVGSKSCILAVQETVYFGTFHRDFLPAQSSASGQPVKEGFVFLLFQSQKKQRDTFCPERSCGTCGRSITRRSLCWRGATHTPHPQPWTRQSSISRSVCQTCHSPCALMASNTQPLTAPRGSGHLSTTLFPLEHVLSMAATPSSHSNPLCTTVTGAADSAHSPVTCFPFSLLCSVHMFFCGCIGFLICFHLCHIKHFPLWDKLQYPQFWAQCAVCPTWDKKRFFPQRVVRH